MQVCEQLLPGYQLQSGSGRDRALLLRFLSLSYQELFPEIEDFSHLAQTIERYFSPQTPLWWVTEEGSEEESYAARIACLWLGTAIDQVRGDRYAHIFLLYVRPEHRRRGIASALMRRAHNFAKARGDRQISLQVFQSNDAAIHLYQNLGYQTQSLLMFKNLEES